MNVPRGTFRPLKLPLILAAACSISLKTEARRIIHSANTSITGGQWSGLDLDSLRPCHPPAEYQLSGRCDMGTSGAHTVGVFSRVKVGDVFWIKNAVTTRRGAHESLVVRAVHGMRLHEIDDAGAIAEGVAAFADLHYDADQIKGDPIYGSAYIRLIRDASTTMRNRWARSELHARVQLVGARPRDCFALMWANLHGIAAWTENPWVWRYQFVYISLPPELAGNYRGV